MFEERNFAEKNEGIVLFDWCGIESEKAIFILVPGVGRGNFRLSKIDSESRDRMTMVFP